MFIHDYVEVQAPFDAVVGALESLGAEAERAEELEEAEGPQGPQGPQGPASLEPR